MPILFGFDRPFRVQFPCAEPLAILGKVVRIEDRDFFVCEIHGDTLTIQNIENRVSYVKLGESAVHTVERHTVIDNPELADAIRQRVCEIATEIGRQFFRMDTSHPTPPSADCTRTAHQEP